MTTLPELKKWFNKNKARILEDYFRFLRFPSISADPAYHADCIRCAEWLIDYLKKGNLHAERIETPTLPIVYAQDLRAGAGHPTVLFYGHYDVQPPIPWNFGLALLSSLRSGTGRSMLAAPLMIKGRFFMPFARSNAGRSSAVHCP